MATIGARFESTAGLRIFWRPMLIGRRVFLGVSAVAGLASTAPGVASAVQSHAAKDAAKRCEWAAVHKAHLGAPLITDQRGSTVAVLFVDRRDNYERFCLYAPHNGVGTSGQIRSPAGSPNPPPSTNGIQHGSVGGSCDPTTGQSVGEMFGRVGSNVTSATFRFSKEPSVPAVIKDGFYVVWWSGSEWPDGIAVTTKSGRTRAIQMRAGRRHSC